MELAVQGNQDCLTVQVIGEVLAESCSDLREAILELTAREAKEIVLELSQMPFIESSGLGVLVGLRAHLRRHGTELRLANPQPRVLETLRMTRLALLFGLED